MSFMFRNKISKKVYTLNEIDEIACKFWGMEVDEHQYAKMWFDVIGHAIEDVQYRKYDLFKLEGTDDNTTTWNYVVANIFRYPCICTHSTEEVMKGIENYKDYINLCFHLESLDICPIPKGW